MQLFSRIPDRFFSILASSKKELYVQALFVVRQAIKTELVIRRTDLVAMLMDSLDAVIEDADFTEEALEEGESAESVGNLSGKASLLLRRLKETGWIETEYEVRSFDENITIPDYAVDVINLLYDLSNERVREYNSYVYATYATLANASATPEYTLSALQAAYHNTISLIDELKTLFNNIRRYYRLIPGENDINTLLKEHFEDYKTKIIDAIYYPLKTMDSVPRFKHPILSILNEWNADDEIQNLIVEQGLSRHVFENETQAREETSVMINYIADTYDSIEEMLDEIDRKHNEYTNASVEHIRYLMNSDRGVKGKLIDLLKSASDPEVLEAMSAGIQVYEYRFADMKSLYSQTTQSRRTEGEALAVSRHEEKPELISNFLEDVRRQYTNTKIDAYIERCFGTQKVFSTEEMILEASEDFILFLLGTIRGRERSAGYRVEFLEGNVDVQGYSLPHAVFRKKPDRQENL